MIESGLAVSFEGWETPQDIDNPVYLLLRNFRVEGQRKTVFMDLFRNRKVAHLVSQVIVAFL